MSRKKKFLLEALLIEQYAAEGKSIAKYQDKIIFVEGAIPGDVVDVWVYKNKKDYAQGIAQKFHCYAHDRIDAFCKHFGVCGGCKWQMLSYEKQLSYKEKQVQDQLQRIGRIYPQTVWPILDADSTTWYRNKLEFTASALQYLSKEDLQAGLPFKKNVIGFHAPKLFDKVIDVETCYLQQDPSNEIKNFIRAFAIEHQFTFYHIKEHKGLLRNIMIRVSSQKEVLVNIQFGEADMENITLLLDALKDTFTIHSLYYTINTKLNDSLYDQDVILYAGKPTIDEYLEDLVFEISPKSFFQTNTKQAEKLYQVVKKVADIKPNETLYDMYCGTGSIGIFLAKNAKKVIGIESVPDAIEDAKKNAFRNQLSNLQFYAGDVLKICNSDFFALHGHADVMIIDPPRAGCHEKFLEKIIDVLPNRIVYVSCNPATQARDMLLLSKHYDTIISQAVDMFPHTHHIENVLLLHTK
ncbi:MAG: 23S rRNA (uracil(1939)-C(5))-methyltransferase RlmD [Chitinophagaceae bacterium]